MHLWKVERMIRKARILGPLESSRTMYLRTIRMAWPSMCEQFLIQLISMADSLMVSGLGLAAVAAVGLCSEPVFIMRIPAFALNVGVVALTARRYGQGDREGANRVIRNALWIGTLFSLATMALGLAFDREILLFMGAEDDAIGMAVTYFRIVAVGGVLAAITMLINGAQRGAGNTRTTMWNSIASNAVNMVLNYLLINGIWFFPRLEVRGAAIATVTGQTVGLVMAVCAMLRRRRYINFYVRASWKPDTVLLRSLFRVSGSAGLEQCFMRFGFFMHTKIVAGLGTNDYATHQICRNLMSISYGLGEGVGVASTAQVGQSLGERRPDKAEIYVGIGQRFAFALSTAMCVFILLLRRQIMGLFTDDPAVIALGASVLIVMACTTHVQTAQVVTLGALRGAGDTRFTAVVGLISVAVLRPSLTWLFCYPMGFGLIGAWFGMLFDQSFRLILSYWRYRSGKWKSIRV